MLFKTRMEEAREALKKLDFDDELILIHAEPGNQELSKVVSDQVAGLIRAKAAVECEPLCYFGIPFGEAARAVYSATPIPLVMSHQRAELHQRSQRLLSAFTLAGSALTLASKYETSIMKPESLAQTTDAHRWMLCLFDAALWGPKGLPGGHVGHTVGLTCEETWEELVATAVHGLPARCWYSRLPNCRDVSVGLIDLMLDIDETNRRFGLSEVKPPAGQPTAAQKKPRGRTLKLVDPQENDIRRAYADCRNIKATVEQLGLKTLRRVTAHTRVQRIVNRDKRPKSSAKKRS